MRHCYVLRVFTRDDVGGNALGVIPDVTGLDTAAMQAIATELGFSETVFLEWESGGLPHARIFTPAAELPFAGHPLVGAAWVLGGPGPRSVDRLTCGIGEVPFVVDGLRARVEVPLVREVEPARDGPDIAAAAGLAVPTASWWVRMPIPYLLLQVADEAAVAITPDFEALGGGPSAEATYVFARDADRVRARFFAPGLGVAEDPATGSAAAALAAVLAATGEPSGALAIDQGAETGFPSRIDVGWSGDTVTLGGSVRRDEVRWLEA